MSIEIPIPDINAADQGHTVKSSADRLTESPTLPQVCEDQHPSLLCYVFAGDTEDRVCLFDSSSGGFDGSLLSDAGVVPADTGTVESLLLGSLGAWHVQQPTMRHHRMVLRTNNSNTPAGSAVSSAARTAGNNNVTRSSSSGHFTKQRSNSFSSPDLVAGSVATGVESLWSFTIPWRHQPAQSSPPRSAATTPSTTPRGGGNSGPKVRRVVVVLALIAPTSSCESSSGDYHSAYAKLRQLEQHPTLVPSCLKKLVPIAFSCARRWFDDSWDRSAGMVLASQGRTSEPLSGGGICPRSPRGSSHHAARQWKLEKLALVLRPRVDECCTQRLKNFFRLHQDPMFPSTAPTPTPAATSFNAPIAAGAGSEVRENTNVARILKNCLHTDSMFTCAVVTAALGLTGKIETSRVIVIPPCHAAVGVNPELHNMRAVESSEAFALLVSWFAFSSPNSSSPSSTPPRGGVVWGDVDCEHQVTIVDILEEDRNVGAGGSNSSGPGSGETPRTPSPRTTPGTTPTKVGAARTSSIADRRRRILKRHLPILVETSTVETVLVVDLTSRTVDRYDQQQLSSRGGANHEAADLLTSSMFVSTGCLADSVPQASPLANLDDVLDSIKQQEQCTVGFGLHSNRVCTLPPVATQGEKPTITPARIVPSEWVFDVLQWMDWHCLQSPTTPAVPPTATTGASSRDGKRAAAATSPQAGAQLPVVSLETALATTRLHLEQQRIGFRHGLLLSMEHHSYYRETPPLQGMVSMAMISTRQLPVAVPGSSHTPPDLALLPVRTPELAVLSGVLGGGGSNSSAGPSTSPAGELSGYPSILGGRRTVPISPSVVEPEVEVGDVSLLPHWGVITATYNTGRLGEQLLKKYHSTFTAIAAAVLGNQPVSPTTTRSADVNLASKGGFISSRGLSSNRNSPNHHAQLMPAPFQPTKLRFGLGSAAVGSLDSLSGSLRGNRREGSNVTGTSHAFNSSFRSNASGAGEGNSFNSNGAAGDNNPGGGGYLLTYSPNKHQRVGSYVPRAGRPQFFGSAQSQLSDDGSGLVAPLSARSLGGNECPMGGASLSSYPSAAGSPRSSLMATPQHLGARANATPSSQHKANALRKLSEDERRSIKHGLTEYTGSSHVLHVQLLHLLNL